MAKDPAFLFYYQDFLVGTSFLDNESKGAYITILCHQADKGHLSETVVKRLCGSDLVYDALRDKFKVDESGLLYNSRLEEEAKKRKEYAESRRQNRNKGNSKSLHIYLIRNPENNLIKIGSSVDPNRRVIELRKQESSNLYIVCYTKKTTQRHETALQKEYKSLRRKGEWFDADANHIINHMTNHMKLTMEYTYDGPYGK